MKPLLIRFGGLLAVLFGITLITFTISYFAPGDKAEAIAHARYPGDFGIAPEVLQDPGAARRRSGNRDSPAAAPAAAARSTVARGLAIAWRGWT